MNPLTMDYPVNVNFGTIAAGIRATVDSRMPLLSSLGEPAITVRRNGQGRSVKQILGHLIDSASNNHQRIVRLQYNNVLDFPDYTQDNDLWIALQDYNSASWDELLGLWKYYNYLIARIIEAADISKLDNYWTDFEGTKVTLRDMILGYTVHLDLHLEEIFELCPVSGNRPK